MSRVIVAFVSIRPDNNQRNNNDKQATHRGHRRVPRGPEARELHLRLRATQLILQLRWGGKHARSRPRWKPLPPTPGGSRWSLLVARHMYYNITYNLQAVYRLESYEEAVSSLTVEEGGVDSAQRWWEQIRHEREHAQWM